MATHELPWQFKIAAKLILSRVPINQRLFHRVGVFNLGGMSHPEYAVGVFRRHFDKAKFARKDQPFVALELGPGTHSFPSLLPVLLVPPKLTRSMKDRLLLRVSPTIDTWRLI